MSGIRISHRPDPKRPEAPDGIITIELNGAPVELPKKGVDKVINVRSVEFQIHSEYGREDEGV